MRSIPVIKFFVCEQGFIAQLKINTVDQRLIDIHDDCRRQVFCIGLIGNCTPRLIGDQCRQRHGRRPIYLPGKRTILGRVADPAACLIGLNVKFLLWRAGTARHCEGEQYEQAIGRHVLQRLLGRISAVLRRRGNLILVGRPVIQDLIDDD